MISVVLASYNGEKYIKKQLDSIMCQLKENDEVIVSDDGSKDDTLKIIAKMAENDSRIKIISGPRKGYNKNFENAIKCAKGDYIFISDQDDVWMPNKVSIILETFKQNVKIKCIRHDCYVVDSNDDIIIDSYNSYRKANINYRSNIIKNTFTGCCMCVEANWLKKLLPFPEKVFYDAWIGIISCKFKNAKVIDDKLIKWCRHEGTVTDAKKRNSCLYILKDRYNLCKNIRKKCREL